MRKTQTKIAFSLLLAILLLFSVFMLAACNNTSDPAGDTSEQSPSDGTSADSTNGTQTDETTADNMLINNLTIAGNELSKYRIVYYKSVYANDCAKAVQTAIKNATGKVLPIFSDTTEETEFEILIGKTNRTESNTVRSDYDRPNVYYDIETVNNKLVIMGEGYTVLHHAAETFSAYLATLSTDGSALSGSLLSGNIIDKIDTLKISMANRVQGTDLRVFHWNMAAPYLDPNVTTPPVVYNSNITRGEVMADIILQLMPDIITTNEFYKSHNGNSEFFNAVMNEMEEYYICLDSPYDKDKPTAGADAIKGKTINSNIIYRRDSGLSVISSSWRYSTEKTTVTDANPRGWVYYHGSHTAVFSLNGQKFILSVSHYADSRSSSKWAKEHLDAIADAQAASGSETLLPVILTGDLYTGFTSASPDSGYKYIASQGYVDAQRNAAINANNNVSHGTFHTIGVRETKRISEDFIWCKGNLSALCFKVLTSKDIDDTSDHYPVMADIKFN